MSRVGLGLGEQLGELEVVSRVHVDNGPCLVLSETLRAHGLLEALEHLPWASTETQHTFQRSRVPVVERQISSISFP